MTRICVDDQVSFIETDRAGNLGELLNSVVSGLPPNKIVKEILLDGEHLPIMSNLPALDSPLGQVQELHIRTADKEIWAATGVDIAASSVERIQRSLIRAAELFREENKAQANHFFAQCIDGLERFLETIMITRCALKLDFKCIQIHGLGLPLSQIEQEFGAILATILECQEKQDFDGVADKVEYELLTNLSAWSSALRQLRVSRMSNA
jgi:hypothetical protein